MIKVIMTYNNDYDSYNKGNNYNENDGDND